MILYNKYRFTMELLWTYYGFRLKKLNINDTYRVLKIIIFNEPNYFVFCTLVCIAEL